MEKLSKKGLERYISTQWCSQETFQGFKLGNFERNILGYVQIGVEGGAPLLTRDNLNISNSRDTNFGQPLLICPMPYPLQRGRAFETFFLSVVFNTSIFIMMTK